jgi:hypothetical protein
MPAIARHAGTALGVCTMSTLDSPTAKVEKPVSNPETYNKLSAAANEQPGTKPDTRPATSESLVKAGTLPSLSIDGAGANDTHSPSGAMAVVKDLGEGAWNQITEHPGQVAESAAIGAVIGVGVALASPEIAVGAAVAGIGYGAYQLYEHAGSWFGAAKVVADQKDYSSEQVAKANSDLKNVGAGSVNVAAGLIGGVAGSYVTGAIVAASDSSVAATAGGDAPATAAPSATTPGGDAPATAAPAATTPGGDAPATAAPAATTPGGDAPATAAPAATTPGGDAPATASPSATTPGSDAPATPSQAATTPGDGTTPGDNTAATDAKPVETPPAVDLDNPTINTNEAALRTAFRDAIQTAQQSDSPITFKVDTTVKLTDAAGNPTNLSQADVLYQELQSAYPDNHFVFSKPNLSPGDPGYSEFPAPEVTEDGLHISTKENPITLAQDTTLPDGTTLPAGSKFAVGTTYNGDTVQSALPGGKVWATTPDGNTVQVADAGQSADVPSSALSTDPKQFGQVVDAKTPSGDPNHIIIRTDAKATAPDGSPLLDAYPSGGPSFDAAYKEGSTPGMWAPKPKLADHFLLPPNVTVEANTSWGASTASGANDDYFMKSGFADAQAPTAKNYSGPTSDAQSTAELARIRAAQGLGPA